MYIKKHRVRNIYICDGLDRGQLFIYRAKKDPKTWEVYFRPKQSEILIEVILRECPKYPDALLIHRIISNEIDEVLLNDAINYVTDFLMGKGYQRLMVRCVDPNMESFLANFGFQKMEESHQPYISGSNTFFEISHLQGSKS